MVWYLESVELKKLTRLLLIIFGVFAGSLGSAAYAADMLLLADPWCPFNCIENEAETGEGILIDGIKSIFPDMKITYREEPWKRSIADVLSGRGDGLVGVGRGEVPSLIFTKKPMAFAKHTFFVRKDDKWEFKGYDSLKNRTIGAIASYSYGDFKARYIDNAGIGNITIVHGDQPLNKLVNLLRAKRIDTIVAEEKVLNYFLAHYHPEIGFKNAGIASLEEIYIGFSPKYKMASKVVDRLNKYLENQNFESLFVRYINNQ